MEIKSRKALFQSVRIFKLKVLGTVLILGIILLYFSLVPRFLENIAPFYGDEYFYVKNAESYALTGEYKAAFTYSGYGSKVGGFDAHGPAYTFLYGLFQAFDHWSPNFIFWINLALLLIGLGLLAILKEEKSIRIFQFCLIMGSPYTLFYGMSLMPELIHIAIAVGLYFAMKTWETKQSNISLGVILFLIILGGLFRVTWFFLLFPFGLNILTKKKAIGIILLITGLLLPILYQNLFLETVPNVFSIVGSELKDGQLQDGIYRLYYNTKRNIYFLITYSEGGFYWTWKIWLICTLIFSLVYQKTSSAFRISTYLFLIQFALTIILYKTYRWTEFRMLSPVALILNLQFLSFSGKRPHFLWVPILGLISFLWIIPFEIDTLEERKEHTLLPIPNNIQSELKTLSNSLVRVDSTVLNLYSLDQLPVVDTLGKSIKYILPYYELKEETASYYLEMDQDQLIVRSTKIRIQ